MAVTDALSVALKMIGVGADVYRGTMEGSKYNKANTQPQAGKQEPTQSQEGLKITHVEPKTGTKKNGTPWTKYPLFYPAA